MDFISYHAVKKIRKFVVLAAFGYVVYLAVVADHPYQYAGSFATALNATKDGIAKMSVAEERKMMWIIALLPAMFTSALLATGIVIDALKIFVINEKGKMKVTLFSTAFYLFALMMLYPIMPIIFRLMSFYL